MSHGVKILAEQFSFGPFKKAIETRNSKFTPTLSPWFIETYQLDVDRRSSFEKSYSATMSCTEKVKAFEGVQKMYRDNPLQLKKELKSLTRHFGSYSGVGLETIWGTMFCPYEHLGILNDGTEPTQEQYKEAIAFNKKVAIEMRSIGVNCAMNEDDMFNPAIDDFMSRELIFVPNAKVVETKYPGLPLTFETDNKSRELMLAYLLHKGFIQRDDPAIAETFPFNPDHVKKIDIEALLQNTKTLAPKGLEL